MKAFSLSFLVLAVISLLAAILDESSRHQFVTGLLGVFMSYVTWKIWKAQKVKK